MMYADKLVRHFSLDYPLFSISWLLDEAVLENSRASTTTRKLGIQAPFVSSAGLPFGFCECIYPTTSSSAYAFFQPAIENSQRVHWRVKGRTLPIRCCQVSPAIRVNRRTFDLVLNCACKRRVTSNPDGCSNTIANYCCSRPFSFWPVNHFKYLLAHTWTLEA